MAKAKIEPTQEELQAAFNLVAPETNWRDRIDTWVPASANIELITKAIVHFTTTVPKIFKSTKRMPRANTTVEGFAIVADGYWARSADKDIPCM